MNPIPQQQPNRIKVPVKLSDMPDYLKQNNLQVVRFEWDGEGLPVVYCENKEASNG